MGALATAGRLYPHLTQAVTVPVIPANLAKARWSLAFVALLGYVVVEYTRLAAMYPVLAYVHPGKITVGLALAGFLLSPIRLGARAGESRILDRAVFAFVLAALVSAVLAASQDSAWQNYGLIARWAIIYLLISRVVSNTWRLRVMMFLLMLLNFKLAQWVIRSYLYELSVGLDEMIIATHGLGAGSTGFFANGSDFGIAMVVIWPIAVSLLFAKPRGLWKLLLLAVAALAPVATLLCGSRGAVVGAGVVAIAAWVRSSRKLAAASLAAVLLTAGLLVYPEAGMERMRSAWEWEEDATASARIRLWKHALRMFTEHPVLGVGPGNFAATRASQNLSETVTHSIYFEALADYGLAGTVSVAFAVLAFFLLNSRTRRQLMARGGDVTHQFEYCLAYGLDLALIGYLASGAFASVLLYPHLWILAALAVGLNAASRVPPPSVGTTQPANPFAPPAHSAILKSN